MSVNKENKNINPINQDEIFLSNFTKILPSEIVLRLNKFNEIEITCSTLNHVEIIKRIRDDEFLSFKQLIDITATDYPSKKFRFQITYFLLSIKNNKRIRINLNIRDSDIVPSVTQLFSSANWAEREIWDMFGIFFSGHPDLRRLLTDYGFEGHHLRKDFPLTGYTEVRYSHEKKQVVYEPVTLTQEFRNFDFESPWETIGSEIKSNIKNEKDT